MKNLVSASSFSLIFSFLGLLLLQHGPAHAKYTMGGTMGLLNQARAQLDRGNCVRADRLLDQADVAIDQILRERTMKGCIDGSLDDLERLARFLSEQGRRLENPPCGMRRSYDNTLDKIRSWRGTRNCTDPHGTFQITGVVHPSEVTAGSGGEDLAVYWKGNPTLPVTMNYFRVGPCPSGYNCVNVSRAFNLRTNPFIFPRALWCDRIAALGTYYFDYAVQLVDGGGNNTQQEAASFNCINR